MKKMIARLLSSLFILALFFSLAACGVVGKVDSQTMSQVDKEIRAEIEKSVPLPESVSIINNIAGNLRYTTPSSVADVVSFYRDAFPKRNYSEDAAQANVSEDSAKLVFTDGQKTITIEVTKNDQGSAIYIRY